jgi:hypothetical protein
LYVFPLQPSHTFQLTERTVCELHCKSSTNVLTSKNHFAHNISTSRIQFRRFSTSRRSLRPLESSPSFATSAVIRPTHTIPSQYTASTRCSPSQQFLWSCRILLAQSFPSFLLITCHRFFLVSSLFFS